MAYDEDAFRLGIISQKGLKISVLAVGLECGVDFDLCFVSELGCDKLRGLEGSFEGAGDDGIDLNLERAEAASHENALFFSVFYEATLGVERGVWPAEAGVGVAHEVKNHRGSFRRGRSETPALKD